jgi:tRNA isopentenyl-2-thiomethyl-A-37 hydroxylase MiaE
MLSEEAWKGYLNSYCAGEIKGAQLIEKLVEFAPDEEARNWVIIWSKEEEHHHRLWKDLMQKRGIPITGPSGTLQKLYDITEDFVENKDWTGSMVSAAIIEHLSNATAAALFKYADPEIRRIFKQITADDLAHLNFDLTQLEKIAQTAEGRKKIIDCHKKFMKEILEWPARKDLLEKELEILNDTYELHRYKLEKIGVGLPKIKFADNFSFKLKKSLMKIFV